MSYDMGGTVVITVVPCTDFVHTIGYSVKMPVGERIYTFVVPLASSQELYIATNERL